MRDLSMKEVEPTKPLISGGKRWRLDRFQRQERGVQKSLPERCRAPVSGAKRWTPNQLRNGPDERTTNCFRPNEDARAEKALPESSDKSGSPLGQERCESGKARTLTIVAGDFLWKSP